ncbi:hypothetical protein GFK26_07740 [Variovorax paradoxus]|uniref:Uncharacterized protein n=1 Tax=Variovorax paradoxus TaxID=34073 RepID=A0A5Q0M1E8_VARPD|nr:O-antigen ligase family protein [Variovorax paradoxus]QFZ82657.1 hypothetical protein GFK26_07740 [Variovorax paradoxus]
MRMMAFLGGMLALSLLNPEHFMPWPAFGNDFLAGIGFFPLGGYVIWKCTGVPKIALPIFFLSLTPLLQMATGRILFLGDGWIAWVYISAAFISVVSAANFLRESKLQNPMLEVQPLILALIAASILLVGISLIQWLDFDFLSEFIAKPQAKGRYGANLAQPNQLAIVLLLGVASTLFLFENRMLNACSATLLAAFLILGLAMTQSRMTFIALFFLWVLFWSLRQRASLRTSGTSILFLSGFFGLMMFAWPLVNEILLLGGAPSLIGRLSKDSRFDIWKSMIDAASQLPWTGYGWGQIPLAQQATALEHPATYAFFDSTHNLGLDIAVSAGLPVAVIFSLWVMLWFKKQIANCRDPLSWSVLLAVGFAFCHAMVEYPLTYAYILLPICFFMGALSRIDVIKFEVNGENLPSFRWGIAGVSVLTLVGFVVVSNEYIRFENDWRHTRMKISGISSAEEGWEAYRPIFLTQLRDYSEFARTVPERGMTEEKILWMSEVAKRFGQPSVLTRYAIAAALNGKPEAAAHSLALLCKTQAPRVCVKVLENWRTISSDPTYPELKLVALPELG